MKTKTFLPLLMLIFSIGFAAAANVDVSSASYDPAPAVPGKYFDLWVNLVNTTKYDAKDIAFELDLDYPFSLEPDENAEKEIAGIKAFQVSLVKYKVLVDAGAVGGKYRVNFNIGDIGGTFKSIPYFVDVKEGAPKIELIQTSTNKIAPGSERIIGLTLKNIGKADASNVIVKVDSQGTQIVPLGATTGYIPLIEAGKSAVVEFTFSVESSATLSTYVVPVSITYSDKSGNETFTSTSSIGLKVSDEPDLDVVIGSAKPKPSPGKSSEISFDMFNIGSGTAKFLVIKLESEKAEFSDDKIFIGTLDSDDFDSFKTIVTFDKNVAGEKVPLKILFSFRNENNEAKTIEKTVYIDFSGQSSSNGAVSVLVGMVGMASTLAPILVIVVVIIVIVYFVKFRKQPKTKK